MLLMILAASTVVMAGRPPTAQECLHNEPIIRTLLGGAVFSLGCALVSINLAPFCVAGTGVMASSAKEICWQAKWYREYTGMNQSLMPRLSPPLATRLANGTITDQKEFAEGDHHFEPHGTKIGELDWPGLGKVTLTDQFLIDIGKAASTPCVHAGQQICIGKKSRALLTCGQAYSWSMKQVCQPNTLCEPHPTVKWRVLCS